MPTNTNRKPRLGVPDFRKALTPEFAREVLLRKYWWLWCLIIITVFALWTRSIPARFGDITGLDEFYIFRMSEYILQHNLQIPEIDMMRYWPDGASVLKYDPLVTFYLPVLLYIMMTSAGAQITFLSWAVIYPAIMGALDVFIIYWIGKEIFNDRKAGLAASLFLTSAGGYIARSAAGSFEKESAGGTFLLLFMLLYVLSYKKGSIKYGALSGVALFLASNAWGGSVLAFYVIPLFIFSLLLMNRATDAMMKSSLTSLPIALALNQLFPFSGGIGTHDMAVVAILGLLVMRYFVGRYKLLPERKLPYLVPGCVLLLFVFILVGSAFSDYIWGLLSTLIGYFNTQKSYLAETVAEQMPGDWNEIIARFTVADAGALLPFLAPVSALFSSWFLMLVGGAVMFYLTLKKRNLYFMLAALIPSLVTFAINQYLGFLAIFAWLVAFSLLFKNLDEDRAILFLPLIWLFLTIPTVFYMVRLTFFLGPPAALAAGIAVSKGIDLMLTSKWARKGRKEAAFYAPVLAAAAFTVLLVSVNFAEAYVTTSSMGPLFNQYWKDAMDFVSTSTPENSSILSWWDFGYWFQTRGHRPSTADGGNMNGTVDEQIAQWFTSPAENWSGWTWWLKGKDVGYILMDYSLPGKYGAITKIASQGKTVVGMLEMRQSGVFPQQNKTIAEFKAGDYTVWIPIDERSSIAGPAIFMVSRGAQYLGRTYVTDYCTTNGILRMEAPAGADTMPGCLAITPYGLFLVPDVAEHNIFTNLMFMDGTGIPDLKKVYDSGVIKIYEVALNQTATAG